MYHTSPNRIKAGTINNYGIAGSCLFFSDDVYQMSNAAVYVYEADFNCVEAYELYDEEIIAEIADKFDVDSDHAADLLDGSASEWDLDCCDAEASWWLQGKRGDCAAKMGYDGCQDTDEQGTVYIIPMMGREAELKRV
jgi:hypothetical protein